MKKTSIRQDIHSFLKFPDFTGFSDLSTKEKVIILVKVLVLSHIAVFIVRIPVLLLQKFGIMSEILMESDLVLKSIQANHINYKPYFIFSIIFFVPLLEEMSFRLFLTRFRVHYFIISVSIFLGMILENSLGNLFWIPKSYLLLSVSGPLYVLLMSALIYCVLYQFRTKINRLEEIWYGNSRLIIYTTTILFAICHLFNLKFENCELVFIPLILLPFFVWGLSFVYIRVRLGIIYSIVLHFMILALRFGIPELLVFLKAYNYQ